MNSPLPTTLAQDHSRELMHSLDTHGCLDYEGKMCISTAPLFIPAGGQMFGVLVCQDPEGHEVVLKAFSGQYQGNWLIDGWVPPVCDIARFNTIVKQSDKEIHILTDILGSASKEEAAAIQKKRGDLSRESLKKLYELYLFRCIDGSDICLSSIFGDELPPTGTGDCCAPKLLNHAFKNGLRPISMSEFYYGDTNRSKTKEHRQFYGPCDQRCEPLLKHMLGLDIIYCDECLIVVNKASGMLSVPGRFVKDCAEARVKDLFPDTIKQPAVHRLDMDTSGLIVYALTKEVHRNLSIQFIKKEVHKEYIAVVEGVIKENSGIIELPFRLDVDHRPYQIYDPQQGKMGITRWKKVQVDYLQKDRLVTRIHFTPETGRTHQLRVHSAHELGLGHPIVGDRLYGRKEEGQRLLLHAALLSFNHPVSGERMMFTCDPEF